MHEEILVRSGHWAREGDFPRSAASIQAGMTEQRVAAVTQIITPTLLGQHIAVYSLHLLRSATQASQMVAPTLSLLGSLVNWSVPTDCS